MVLLVIQNADATANIKIKQHHKFLNNIIYY